MIELEKIVEEIIISPREFVMNVNPGLSNNNELTNNETVKHVKFKMINLSFLKNGMRKIKIPIGIIKNEAPPQAEIAHERTIPPKISRKNLLLDCPSMPLKNRYNEIVPKNKPNGSDLNQPKLPRMMIGVDTENNRAANNPDEFPPINLTTKNMDTVVREPTITGKIIVKS